MSAKIPVDPKVIKFMQDGGRICDAERRFGYNEKTIRRMLRETGNYNERAIRPYTPQEREQIADMLALGMTGKDIAKAIGRPPQGVQRYIASQWQRKERPAPNNSSYYLSTLKLRVSL